MPLPDRDVFREAEELLTRRLAALQRRLQHPRTSARLVLTPERMVIEEASRAHTELSLFEVSCDAVVLNRMLPPQAGELEFFRGWRTQQEELRREIEERFAPLPVLEAPLQEDEVTGLVRLAAHARQLFAAHEPDALLSEGERVRFTRSGRDYLAIVPLPHADARTLDVAKVDDDLVVSTPARRRRVKLPRRLAALTLAEARLEGASLVVALRARGGLMRVLLHTGKGGVGKTSVAVATALGAAATVTACSALHRLGAQPGDALARPVGPQPVEIAPNVIAQEISALAEMERSWSAIQDWLRALLREQSDELAAEELLVLPGWRSW